MPLVEVSFSTPISLAIPQLAKPTASSPKPKRLPRRKPLENLSQEDAVVCFMPNVKVSDGSQPPMTFHLSLSESAGSRSLDRFVVPSSTL